MSTLLAPPTVVEITIKGATYGVEAIDPGFAGVAAVEVRKIVSGESYAVVLQVDGSIVCECPDFVVRHADKGTHCKHCRAAVEHGLLVAPVSGGSPSATLEAPAKGTPSKGTPVPITPADRKRAAYFGLNIPRVEPAPVIEHKAQNEPQPPAAELAPEVEPTHNPRDSWPAWTDADRWEPTPEAAGLDLSGFATPADHWLGESVALLETLSAIEDSDEGGFYRLDQEYQAAFSGFLASIESPAATWPAWLALCRSGSPVSFPAASPARQEAIRTSAEATNRAVRADLDRLAVVRARREAAEVAIFCGFVPSADDRAEAARIFADSGRSCVFGESGPPIGDRSYPRRKPGPRFNGISDHDVYRPGAWS